MRMSDFIGYITAIFHSSDYKYDYFKLLSKYNDLKDDLSCYKKWLIGFVILSSGLGIIDIIFFLLLNGVL